MHYTSVQTENIRVADLQVQADSAVDIMIAPYRSIMESEMNQVIGYLENTMIKERPECTLGNWLADMIHEEAEVITGLNIDFAVQNYGGIRVTSVADGPITVGEIYEIMPFDNLMTIIKASGEELMVFINHMAKSGGWPISAGLNYDIRDDSAVNITISGVPLNNQDRYVFVVPDYIANGGSGSFFLREYEQIPTASLIRDAFITHILKDTQSGINQHAEVTGRINILENE